jgi:RecB family exonuclease
MPLALLVGPANAGKVARLLDGYLETIDRDPVLVVPNRFDRDRVERDLLARCDALMGGTIGTFDDLFEAIARGNGDHRPVATPAQRALVLRRALASTPLNGLSASARYGGFAGGLLSAISELEGALLAPEDVGGRLGPLYSAYLAELERFGLWDRDLERRHAVERIENKLDAWEGRPVFAYGFEDLTGAQWALLRALAGRAEVTVSLPYEPGRAVFDSLGETMADLSRLAGGSIEELAPAPDGVPRALRHVERHLFGNQPPTEAPALEGAIRFLEGAGARGSLELVADEILALLRGGAPAEQIAVVVPVLEQWRAPLETAFGTLGVPFSFEGRVPLGQTAFGQALLSALRFVWREPERRHLFTFLRSPFSGLPRAHADYLEGRLRGLGVRTRVEERTVELRGNQLPALGGVRSASTPLEAVRSLASFLLRAAHGVESPPVGESSKLDLRAYEETLKVVAELEGWSELGGAVSEEDVLAALEDTTVRLGTPGAVGRVAVLDLLRARTRQPEIMFVLGLEEGRFPRRSSESPFLGDEERRALDDSRGARLSRPDPVSRARYLFYTACTRPSRRLYLVRESATDDGGPRQPSPFWDEVRLLLDPNDVARWTRTRRLSSLTWTLEQAPTERERLRALASLAVSDAGAAGALAAANGWTRRLERARTAFRRSTRLANPVVLEGLGARAAFGATELEAFATCSSIWFVERLIAPRSIDAEVDAKLRGSLAHTALHKFFSGLPREVGTERVEPERLDDSLRFLNRCLDEALAGVRQELTDLERRELAGGLRRDLENFVRAEAEADLPLAPRRFEVGFGSERSAPELQRGLDLGGFTVSGKIDRVDVDPLSARGIVQDYKSGKTAYSAAKIESELKLQIPLYMLVLRDLIGIEPLGGLYRALAGDRQARGLLRASAEDVLPGFTRTDYKDDDEFWAQVDGAVDHARRFVGRIRAGDVRHDPLGDGGCPSWCELAPLCRVSRT